MWYNRVVQLQNHLKSLYYSRSLFFPGCVNELQKIGIVSNEWSEAKPTSSLPGPTRFQLLRAFLPGGYLRGESTTQLFAILRRKYGDIFLLPGTFGKRDVVFTFNPDDFQTIYTTEGERPVRRGLEIIQHYRKIHKGYNNVGGLVGVQGEDWKRFRSIVNTVLMNPRNTKVYAPKLNEVADDFIARIRSIRDPESKEVPANFDKEINHWAMDSVGLIALDTDLGMIRNSAVNPKLRSVIDGMPELFELYFILDMQPSLWKYIATPTYKKIMASMTEMSELMIFYIDQAIERLEQEHKKRNGMGAKIDDESGVLERLLNIDRSIAVVMAVDTLLGGVVSTSSAIASCLMGLAKNPDKQQKLREEIQKILPTKNSAMTADKMKNLPYLRACIKEALRVFPVITTNFRATGQDVVLSGYRVPKDTDVVMPWHALSEDAKYFGRPSEYIPERWLRGASPDDCPLNRNAQFLCKPFGSGARMCVGKRIVDLEMEIILAKLVHNFEIHFDYSAANMFKTNIVNVPAIPLQFKFIDVIT